MYNEIENNSIIITNNSYKTQLLTNMKNIINVKFYTLEEFINNLYFNYDERAILFLVKKYNIKISLALEYLNNLLYIEDKKYSNDKLDFLVKIKQELIDNKLLIFNHNFKNYIKNKKIIIYKYELNKFYKYLLRNIDYFYIETPMKNYIPKVYEFNNIEEEVEYVAWSISKLIDDGVSIDKIKLTNITDDYINIIKKIFNFYNLKINKDINIPIISTVIGNTFFNNLNKGITLALEVIDKYKETEIYNQIVDICNKYIWLDNIDDLKILIEYDLNTNYIKMPRYTNEIEVVDFKNYIFDDEYVFMLGFNQGVIPKLLRDEDYISDNIKPIYMDSTIELNKLEKDFTIKCIRNIKNLIITYKLKTSFNMFYPSSLLVDLNLNKECVEIDSNISYSNLSNSLSLAKMYDNLIKFGEKDNKLSLLSCNFDIPYNTYSNSFTGISKNKIKDYIKSLEEFNLSYSSMDDYNRCAFKFYIEKILCLKSNSDEFSIFIGNLYHYILQLSTNNDINVNYEVYKYIEDKKIILKKNEEFFINRTIDNIKYLIDVIKEQNSYSKLNIIETEKSIKIPLFDNINFIGFIDKIMYENDDNEVLAGIIDYKTYIKTPSLKYAQYGIGLQLPVYMYLASYFFKNIRFVGFYMQNIILDNKSEEEKKDSLKLIGYTNKSKELLEHFDYNYTNSKVIKGIKVNNDGSFSANSLKNMIDDKGFNELIKLTKEKIYETLESILNSSFDINPKFDKICIGCEFCKFKDLCFMKESDYVNIKVKED